MNKEQSMKHSELQASWWIAYATTGACIKRNMSKSGVQLTDDEKVADALETAQRHIRTYRECCES